MEECDRVYQGAGRFGRVLWQAVEKCGRAQQVRYGVVGFRWVREGVAECGRGFRRASGAVWHGRVLQGAEGIGKFWISFA